MKSSQFSSKINWIWNRKAMDEVGIWNLLWNSCKSVNWKSKRKVNIHEDYSRIFIPVYAFSILVINWNFTWFVFIAHALNCWPSQTFQIHSIVNL